MAPRVLLIPMIQRPLGAQGRLAAVDTTTGPQCIPSMHLPCTARRPLSQGAVKTFSDRIDRNMTKVLFTTSSSAFVAKTSYDYRPSVDDLRLRGAIQGFLTRGSSHKADILTRRLVRSSKCQRCHSQKILPFICHFLKLTSTDSS